SLLSRIVGQSPLQGLFATFEESVQIELSAVTLLVLAAPTDPGQGVVCYAVKNRHGEQGKQQGKRLPSHDDTSSGFVEAGANPGGKQERCHPGDERDGRHQNGA